MGWHIWHTNSFAPFYRAEQDYQMFTQFSDFLKVVMYHNSGGPRMARYIQNIHSTLFADLTPEQTTEITYRLQQYTSEATLDKLPTAGLSADYVRRETRRAVTGVGAAAGRRSGRASRSTFPPARTRKRRRQTTFTAR